jgi:hypothetical protein
MSETRRTTEQILKDAQRTLDTAEMGYALFTKQSENRLSGLMNLTVFGVAVSSVLQNLRHLELDFDQWYKKFREEMVSDPLMKYFWDLRSEILKEGKLPVGTATHIKRLDRNTFGRIPPPPPNVKIKGFFMGDNFGGNGYEILLPDGSVQKYYVDIPSDIVTTSLHFRDSPKTHLGKNLPDQSIERLSRLYLDYLQRMVAEAKAKFWKKTIV